MKFQTNYYENAFMKRFKAFSDAGIFPDYLLRHKVEFSPIDETAKAVVKAAQYARNKCVFHISSNKEIEFSDLLSILKQLGTELKIVDGKQFDEELNEFSSSEKTEHIFETFQTDMDKSGRLVYDSDIKIVNDFTVDFLKKIGFEWPDIGYDYISRYVRYLKNLDFSEAESE